MPRRERLAGPEFQGEITALVALELPNGKGPRTGLGSEALRSAELVAGQNLMGWMVPFRDGGANMVVIEDHQRWEPSMSKWTTIGLDLAKTVFQVYGIDDAGNVVLRKRSRRGQVLAFFAGLPRCLVGLEACATAHHRARKLIALGHDVRLIPPKDIKAYVRLHKNDAADAEAICKAVQRPSMRFVPVKTIGQQYALMMHPVRDLLIRQRTMLVNALRDIWPSSALSQPRACTRLRV